LAEALYRLNLESNNTDEIVQIAPVGDQDTAGELLAIETKPRSTSFAEMKNSGGLAGAPRSKP